MKHIPRKVKSVTKKSANIIKTEGLIGFGKRSTKYVYYKQFPEKRSIHYKDILFINGCTLPHPTRYRVDHQKEQLEANGLTVDSVFYDQLQLDRLKYYRGFIFFRCPVTENVREFIKQAKEHNKTCFFDIDDLVIDQKYTDLIGYVQQMTGTDKDLYNDGVNRMRETLKLCDYAITTTERLKDELSKYINEVFINRNVASDEMVHHSLKALDESAKDISKVVLGYFSGSITHNEDFSMILPSIVKLMEKYDNLYLKIVGDLDLPNLLKKFESRVMKVDFMDWRTMQKEIATCDINLAPLTKSIFNEAKSENKWTEAALVKVVTVASNLGAFKKVIKNNETGLLVNNKDDWLEALDSLIIDKRKRERLGSSAHKEVLEKHVTIYTGMDLASYVRGRLSPCLGFVLPSTDISGGVNVVLKHAEILKKNGYDVTIINLDTNKKKVPRMPNDLNMLLSTKTVFDGYFDNLVATLWLTLVFVKKYPNVKERSYFIQNFETDFYEYGNPTRLHANATYSETIPINYITMSPWCQEWLKNKFKKDAKCATNGLELNNYVSRTRKFDKKGKIRILIEGDSRDHYKNVDESFKIVDELDPNKFEIVYLSYRSEPKKTYKVDEFYNRIAPDKVGAVYASCDILIKSSILESFSYPPIEMMATGGYVVACPNGGNLEYLKDEENSLFYQQGSIESALTAIDRIVNDEKLRNKLKNGGISTAKTYDWKYKEKEVLSLYRPLL